MLLQAKVALITGASRGIGQAIALALGHEGATVVGTATTEAGANHITKLFEEQQIAGCGLVLDVVSQASVDAAMGLIKERYGATAILVNNAAITHDNLLLRMKDDEWFKVIETNLNSIYRLTKICLRDMIKMRWGRVINIGSVVGSSGNIGQTNYAATKAGMVGFGKALACEVGARHITVNTVAPGFIDTDMSRKISEEHRELLMQRIPLQRLGHVEDIASAVVFLASEKASYITGQTLHVNGGMYMN
jgi:3-oxoacyl-[acyl-carrier protein] reductase